MTIIEVTRSRPNIRIRQLETVLNKFGLVPDPDLDGESCFSWINSKDGRTVTLAINLADDAKAPELIRELRMCGFVVKGTKTKAA